MQLCYKKIIIKQNNQQVENQYGANLNVCKEYGWVNASLGQRFYNMEWMLKHNKGKQKGKLSLLKICSIFCALYSLRGYDDLFYRCGYLYLNEGLFKRK